MSELGNVDLAGEFTRYRETMLAEVEVPGPAEARRTVRRRRRHHLATAAAAAVALLGGPAVGYAALDRSGPPPEPVRPTPSASPTPTPSGSPNPTGPPSPTTASPSRTAPDGRISRQQLAAARVDLPAWRPGPACPTDGVRLAAEAGSAREKTNAIEEVETGDVDGDGAAETVALIRCALGSGGPQQAVAFDRDDAGRIVTVGRITASTIEQPQWLTGLDVRADGVVRVQVADLAPGGGWPGDWSQRQWRGYRWSGERFTQVEGPTSFGPNPYSTDLAVTAKDLILADDPTDGSRVGAIQVRIRNLGDRRADAVPLTLDLPVALLPYGSAWSGCGPDPGRYRPPLSCDLGPVEAGGELVVRLGVRLPPGARLTPGTAAVRGAATGPGGYNLLDPDVDNNEDTIAYR
ncbi:hypothetical protein [Micromonospora sp. CPCC 205556]|uniref:hypothetical protein n=1 Tax=Micromonospora sp. CPCC 205556 TaxID=3122398 RepID=UPI002FEF4F1C